MVVEDIHTTGLLCIISLTIDNGKIVLRSLTLNDMRHSQWHFIARCLRPYKLLTELFHHL